SGEKARPFGRTKLSTSRVIVPRSGVTRYTPAKDRSHCSGAEGRVHGSVKYTQPSDLTTTSLGRLSRRPWKLLAITVRLPSASCRVTRRLSCSHATRRPWRSLVNPLARFVGSLNVDTPCPGTYFMRLLL